MTVGLKKWIAEFDDGLVVSVNNPTTIISKHDLPD